MRVGGCPASLLRLDDGGYLDFAAPAVVDRIESDQPQGWEALLVAGSPVTDEPLGLGPCGARFSCRTPEANQRTRLTPSHQSFSRSDQFAGFDLVGACPQMVEQGFDSFLVEQFAFPH